MNELELRKQLLIAESELNRAQLHADTKAIRSNARTLTTRAASMSSIVASSVVLATGLVNNPLRRSVGADIRPSRLQSLIKGVSLVATLWLAYLSQKHDSHDP